MFNSELNSNLGGKIKYNFSTKGAFNYGNSSVSFSADVGKVYLLINRGYQGTQTLSISNVVGATVIKNITSSTSVLESGYAIALIKATSTSVSFTATARNNTGFILECDNNDEVISDFSKITRLEKVYNYTYGYMSTSPINGIVIALRMSYQGSQTQYLGNCYSGNLVCCSNMNDVSIVVIRSNDTVNILGHGDNSATFILN